MTRIAQIFVAAAIGLLALGGCGGGSSKKAASTPTTPTTPTTATTPAAPTGATGAPAPTPAPASSSGLTAAGSTLKIGQKAVIAYDDASNHKKSTIEVTPKGIEKGSIGDFKNIKLDADQKTATPYYAKVSVKNVGKKDLTGSEPGSYIDGVDDRGQLQNEIIFFGDFARCESASKPKLKPGDSYETCLTYLIPKGGSIVGFRWIFFDEKSGKSDINWK